VLVPVGGILIAHFFFARRPVAVADLYNADGPYGRTRGFSIPGVIAWGAGSVAYTVGDPLGGGTVPALVTAIAVYLAGLRAVHSR
jgi:purine-cytosine permease-like protein